MARIMPTSAFTNSELGVQSQVSKNHHSSIIEPKREGEREKTDGDYDDKSEMAEEMVT